ncbi:probable low-specificity L-threonine aldolase 2 [Chelonus insularis]|uniref:probable low-specificity L-threonine aldolase 2 n=1 Tax=Chelonus insularis TaxID=460826 RepID=UPI00158BAE3C|nr:probable low-specificity L-threonine aldolase 2 [Chelonus insularis]
MYQMKNTTDSTSDKVIIVNLRSDTFTKPSQTMRQAMFEAEVGDDVCREDPTVIKLEQMAANLLGTEAALFVSSGSMGNLIAAMVHCNVRGCEVYLGEESHIVQHEQGSLAQIAGVTIYPLPNNHDGTFDLDFLQYKIRNPNDVHHPISRMIAVENTINGKILPVTWLNKVVEFAKKNNLKLHMDGARLWNAVIASNISVKEVVRGFDSVSFCLSKGLGAPVGSLLCGSNEFITQARRCRKALGGGMRQVGIIAAAGLVALENRFRLASDHEKATKMMTAINNVGSKVIYVDPKTVQTNMVFVIVKGLPSVTAETVVERLQVVEDDHKDDKVIVQAWAEWRENLRLVFHVDITDEMLEAAIRKVIYVIKKLDPALHQ